MSYDEAKPICLNDEKCTGVTCQGSGKKKGKKGGKKKGKKIGKKMGKKKGKKSVCYLAAGKDPANKNKKWHTYLKEAC